MRSDTTAIRAIPTNIITGFLGTGKTTAILHLLKSKPQNERWAVLVNEFGEIGVDGSLIEGKHNNENGVFIREVPGGCMCCTAGLPMQIALTQLLAKARPDRLLIEPTGLGHPKEVLQVLSEKHFKQVLSLQKTLTLVDARKLSDIRYTSHSIFNQQINIADTIIGNKLDLYQQEDKEALVAYIQQHGQAHTDIIFTEHGEIPLLALQGTSTTDASTAHHHNHPPAHEVNAPVSEAPIPECGFIKATNNGEGYSSMGWRFSPNMVFSHIQLLSLLTGLRVERMKAVFITDEGVFGYNLTSDALTEMALDDCLESRLEIIAVQLDESFEEQLLCCVLT